MGEDVEVAAQSVGVKLVEAAAVRAQAGVKLAEAVAERAPALLRRTSRPVRFYLPEEVSRSAASSVLTRQAPFSAVTLSSVAAASAVVRTWER